MTGTLPDALRKFVKIIFEFIYLFIYVFIYFRQNERYFRQKL